MAVTLTMDVRPVAHLLGEMRERLEDLTPVMESIGQDILTATDLAFRDQQSPFGNAWAPLSPVTLARRKGTTAKILRNTGVLANSMKPTVDRKSVRVGTDVVYAVTHQGGAKKGAYGKTKRGSPIPWGDIPARPFVPITDDGRLPEELQGDILDTLAFYLESGNV